MRRGTALRRNCANVKRVHATERHRYLVVAGVRPAAQRRWLGSLLMQQGLTRQIGIACLYLETADPANVAYYERFGFSVIDHALELVPGGPAHVAMWPHKAAESSASAGSRRRVLPRHRDPARPCRAPARSPAPARRASTDADAAPGRCPGWAAWSRAPTREARHGATPGSSSRTPVRAAGRDPRRRDADESLLDARRREPHGGDDARRQQVVIS